MQQPTEGKSKKLKRECGTTGEIEAAPQKYGAHSGIKFVWNPKKQTEVKPFSFDARPRTAKIVSGSDKVVPDTKTAIKSKEKEAKRFKPDEQPKIEKGVSGSGKFVSDTKTAVKSKEKEAKRLKPDEQPKIEKGVSGSNKVVPDTKIAATSKEKEAKRFKHDEQVKIEKDVQVIGGALSRKKSSAKVTETEVKSRRFDARLKSEKVASGNIHFGPASASTPKMKEVIPIKSEKTARKMYPAHSGLKFIPTLKQDIVAQSLKFKSRSAEVKELPSTKKGTFEKTDEKRALEEN